MLNYIQSYIPKLSVFWLVFLISLLVRILYHFIGIEDFWGDSYHNVYISWLTATNDWAYSDYSGREVVWLPSYRYLSGALMYLFNSYSLEVGYALNSVLSAVCCGVVALLVQAKSSRKLGLYAGITLGLLPWYLAYSHMNMPEVLASLILVLMLYVWHVQRYLWLVMIAFIGVLTRNEVTLVMMVLGIILLLQRNWKPALLLVFGSVVGLGIWGIWCYHITGEFFWWISERIVGSTWVNAFQKSQGYGVDIWYYPVISIFIAFPFIVLLILKPKSLYRTLSMEIKANNWFLPILALLLVVHWSFIFSLQFGVIGYPDPKYYVVTLPIAVMFFFIYLHHLRVSGLALNGIMIFTVVFMMAHLLPFSYMHHSDLNSYKIANFVKENPPGDGNIWMDFTSAWYLSDISPNRIFSSKQLAPKNIRLDDNFVSVVEDNIIQKNIRYVMAAPASFTFVLDLFPEMRKDEDFTWGNLRFQQLYKYTPNDSTDNSNWMSQMAIGSSWASFWKVTPIER